MNELKEWVEKNRYTYQNSLDAVNHILYKIEELEKKKCVWNKTEDYFIRFTNCGKDTIFHTTWEESQYIFCPFCGLQIECEELKN